jgi:hypothetical protein
MVLKIFCRLFWICKIAFEEWNHRNQHHPEHGEHLKGQDMEPPAPPDLYPYCAKTDEAALFGQPHLSQTLLNF